MKRTLLLFIGILILWSCAKENSSPQRENEGPPTRMERLQTLALELPAMLGETPTTRSTPKQIREIFPLGDLQLTNGTRSAPEGSGESAMDHIFIVNYEDDAGFAILSDDSRLPAFFGYSDYGNITDTLSNPGLQMVLSVLPSYAQAQFDSMIDPEEGLNLHIWERTYIASVSTSKGPYLSVKWGQHSPYNLYAPVCQATGYNMLAGCVATALVQIMSYHGHPASINYNGALSLNWNNYRAYPKASNGPSSMQDEIGRIFRYVGDKVGMNYGCSESGSNIIHARGALIGHLGYQADWIVDYSWARAKADLDNNKPLFIRGSQVGGYLPGGHAWVLDGYKVAVVCYEEWIDVYDDDGRVIDTYLWHRWNLQQNLLHCNWGWDGYGNGYFVEGIFQPETPAELDPGSGRAIGAAFISDMEIIKNIRPN